MRVLMRQCTVGIALCALFVSSVSAHAQQRLAVSRVGVLEPGYRAGSTRPGCSTGFRTGMQELGWMGGEKLHIEERYGEFQPERLNQGAAELVRIAPTVIWTHSPPAVHAAKRATSSIPIVVGVASDMIEQGMIEGSLARPTGNVTGMELRDLEIMGKRLELLKEVLPSVSRVAILVDPTNSTHARVPANMESEARTLKVQFQRFEASSRDQLDAAFASIRADAVMIPEGAMFSQNRQRLFTLANGKRLPTIAGGQQFAEAGGLLSYGASINDTCRRSATFVDKILKGAKPHDLPVERPTKFELAVNLKTANQIGLTVPPSVLARADRVIR